MALDRNRGGDSGRGRGRASRVACGGINREFADIERKSRGGWGSDVFEQAGEEEEMQIERGKERRTMKRGEQSQVEEEEGDVNAKRPKVNSPQSRDASSERSGDVNEGRGAGRKEQKRIVVLRFGEGDQESMKKINPIALTKTLSNQLGKIEYARVLPDGNLLISCADDRQLEKAKAMKVLGKYKVVQVGRVGERRGEGRRGVITGVSLSLSEKQLLENLEGGEVISVKRLQRTKNGSKVDSETVLLEFSGEGLPERVHLGFISYPVRIFVPRPLRCFNCQRFGHKAQGCKDRRRCAICGGDHEYGECGEGVKPKCCSCEGEHSVAFGGCEVMRREVSIQKARVKGHLSYAQAVRVVGGQDKEGNGREARETMGREVERHLADGLYVGKKELVTFIAGVINSTYGEASKTVKTKLVFKAALSHLGGEGLSWEELEEDLHLQSGGNPQRS